MKMHDILVEAVNNGSSDVFIVGGLPLTYKIHGQQQRMTEQGDLMPRQTEELIFQLYDIAHRDHNKIRNEDTDDDFSVALDGIGRFRVNAFHQRGSLAAVVRVIRFGIPRYQDLDIPEEVMSVTRFHQGVVLVTGQVGAGKSTTLACIVDAINQSRTGHILTLEDPIEYVHSHSKCIVSQREVFSDCTGYLPALRSALRESPDVILLGEMRDYETIDVAMKAAETGQLLLSSLHTSSAASTVDRIIDTFPANQQAQIRLQLSMVLQAVISQQLVPDVDGKLIPVFEIMFANPAIRNLIRESKTHQMDAAIQAGAAQGMRTMDGSLLTLYRKGRITKDTVMRCCLNYEATSRKLSLL